MDDAAPGNPSDQRISAKKQHHRIFSEAAAFLLFRSAQVLRRQAIEL
jgi:hypothetical protein